MGECRTIDKVIYAPRKYVRPEGDLEWLQLPNNFQAERINPSNPFQMRDLEVFDAQIGEEVDPRTFEPMSPNELFSLAREANDRGGVIAIRDLKKDRIASNVIFTLRELQPKHGFEPIDVYVIDSLATLSDYRGKGFAKICMEIAERTAALEDPLSHAQGGVHLVVSDKGAADFYKKLGYQLEKKELISCDGSNEINDMNARWWMYKPRSELPTSSRRQLTYLLPESNGSDYGSVSEEQLDRMNTFFAPSNAPHWTGYPDKPKRERPPLKLSARLARACIGHLTK